MNRTFIAAIALAAATTFPGAAKDEVIMTVNGTDVTRSEFEYLYHKNQQQQVDPQTLEDYAEMFKIYKLKVADALDQRLDTLSSFRQEMEQYRTDLAKPYMVDSVYLNSLVKEAFDRSREEVEAFHIMLAKGRNAGDNEDARVLADSIRTALLGGADYAELAKKYSVDRGSSNQGGRMGYILEGRFPYSFEKAAFELRPGEISEIVESPQGYHILKGGKHRPARGTVLVQHIMKMVPEGASAEAEAAAKASIDSIYAAVVAQPKTFDDVARRQSDDKGSGRQGGRLNWFGAGMMVEPFDSAAFAIGVNEISKPVRSQFGWHIIRKLDARGPESLEQMKPAILQRVTSPNDERSLLVRKNLIANLASKHKAKLNEKNIDALCRDIPEDGLDSIWFAKAADIKALGGLEIAKIGKKGISLSEWAGSTTPAKVPNRDVAASQLRSRLESFFGNRLIEAEEQWLDENEPAYSNLLKEYREGSLLYEASLRRVWDKAAKDTEGLNRYFEAHRDDYKWQRPHVKGILVQATDDSIANSVRKYLADMKDESEIKAIRKSFVGKVTIEPILMEQGQNGMVDNIMFGGAPVTPSNKKYTVYFLWEPRLLDAPECMNDVKGLVTSDWQNQLETDWVEQLKARYPVTVNKKVLNKVK